VDKAEAINVLREVFVVCPEIGNADFVSLDPENASENSSEMYKIRLRIKLDSQLIDCVQKILDARKLKITETKDLVVISRPNVSE